MYSTHDVTKLEYLYTRKKKRYVVVQGLSIEYAVNEKKKWKKFSFIFHLFLFKKKTNSFLSGFSHSNHEKGKNVISSSFHISGKKKEQKKTLDMTSNCPREKKNGNKFQLQRIV